MTTPEPQADHVEAELEPDAETYGPQLPDMHDLHLAQGRTVDSASLVVSDAEIRRDDPQAGLGHGSGGNDIGLRFPHMEGGELVFREHVVDFGELIPDASPDSGRWVWMAADLAAPEAVNAEHEIVAAPELEADL